MEPITNLKFEETLSQLSDFARQIAEIEKQKRIPTVFVPHFLLPFLEQSLHNLIQMSFLSSHIEILDKPDFTSQTDFHQALEALLFYWRNKAGCRFPNCNDYAENFGYCEKHYKEQNRE